MNRVALGQGRERIRDGEGGVQDRRPSGVGAPASGGNRVKQVSAFVQQRPAEGFRIHREDDVRDVAVLIDAVCRLESKPRLCVVAALLQQDREIAVPGSWPAVGLPGLSDQAAHETGRLVVEHPFGFGAPRVARRYRLDEGQAGLSFAFVLSRKGSRLEPDDRDEFRGGPGRRLPADRRVGGRCKKQDRCERCDTELAIRHEGGPRWSTG